MQLLLTLENLNPVRDLNLGWVHLCEPKSATKIASVRWSIKIVSGEQTLLVGKLMRQSTRPKQRVGKISFKTSCTMEVVLTCRKLSKVSTILLMLTLVPKLCPTTVKLSLILNLKQTPSLTTTQGLAYVIYQNPTVIPTDSSGTVLKYHLLRMRAVLYF